MNIPDLSHLTKEEQQQILSVIKRQQDEEQKEKTMIKNLNEQFENYKENVRKASENANTQAKISPTKSMTNMGQICLLCHKTKIANGCGHTCSYCQLLFCSRCGGRVPLKSSKIMWVCNLCRKQQDLLTKTGNWYHGTQKEQQPGLTLNLEPVSALDKAMLGNKMTGSASLAVMETDHRSKSLTTKQINNLKKEKSEPHLAMTERISNSTPELNKKSKESTNRKEVEDLNADSNGSSNGKMHGVRRSSTHSERRLYRQEQAVAHVPDQIVEAPVQESENFSRLENSFGHENNQMNHSRNSSQSSDRSSKFKIMQDSLNQQGKLSTNLKVSGNNQDFDKTYDSSKSASPQLSRKQDLPERTNRDHGYNYTSGNHVPEVRDSVNGRKLLTVDNINRNRSRSNSPAINNTESAYSKINNTNSYQNNVENSYVGLDQSYTELFDSNRSRSPHITPQNHHGDLVKEKNTRMHQRSTYDLSDPGDSYDQRIDRKYTRHQHAASVSDTEGGSYMPYLNKQQYSEIGASRRRIKQKHSPGFSDYTSMHELSSHQKPSPLKSYSQDQKTLSPHSDKMGNRRGRKYLYDSRKRSGYKGSYDNLTHQERYMDRSHRQRRMNMSSHALDLSHHRKYHTHGREVLKYIQRNPSLSSTDEEFQPNYSSCEENDPVSRITPAIEKNGFQLSNTHPAFLSISSPWHKDLNQITVTDIKNEEQAAQQQLPAKKVQFTKSVEIRDAKKNLQNNSSSPTSNKTSFPNQLPIDESVPIETRDSGFDTGSSINTIHSEDMLSNQQPVSWQPSNNGRFLIGRMMLNKCGDNLNTPQHEVGVLGLKVVGGKVTESERLGAFITKVKPGSVADVVGQLKPGDEVIMWNKHCFQDATFNEVYDCVLESKHKQIIELMVSRPIKEIPQISDQEHNVAELSSSSFESQKLNGKPGMYRPHVNKYSSSNQLYNPKTENTFTSPGSVQIKLWYDENTKQLYITTLQAIKLQSRRGGQTRNPYIKMYLLPDRSEASKRRTKTAKKTLNPVWNQSFVYGPIRQKDLGSLSLEITLWDLDRSVENNNHFLGKVFVELGLASLDNQPYWFDLQSVNHDHQSTSQLSSSSFATRSKGTNVSPARRSSESSNPYQEYSAIPSNRHFRESVDYQRPSQQISRSTSSNLHGQDLLRRKEESYLPSSSTQHEDLRYKTHQQYKEVGHSSSPSFVKEPYYKQEEHNSFSNQNHPHHRHENHSKKTVLPNSNNKPSHARKYREEPRDVPDQSSNEVVPPRERAVSVDESKASTAVDGKTNKSSVEAISKSMSLGRNLHTRHKAKENNLLHSGRGTSHSNSPKSRKSNLISNKLTSKIGVKSQSSCQLENNCKKGSSARTSEYGVAHELTREGSKDSSGSLPSLASEGSSCVDKTLQDFVGSLGPGQAVGRQTLAANSLGDLELGLYERQGVLEVQVIRGRNLIPKANCKVLPATYAKVYLMFGLQCVAKKKTKIARRTLDPLFHQTISFDPSQYGNAVQVIVWGDYGRMDHKAFMGVVQVKLENLDLSTNSIGWYRLFPTTSIVDATSLTMNQQGSMTSLESDANTFKS